MALFSSVATAEYLCLTPAVGTHCLGLCIIMLVITSKNASFVKGILTTIRIFQCKIENKSVSLWYFSILVAFCGNLRVEGKIQHFFFKPECIFLC